MSESASSHLRLSDSLSPGAIILELQSKHRDSVLQELVAHVPAISANKEAQERLLRALQEREQLCSTGIGDGIALPHCRNALVGLVDKPVVVFGRHPQGLAYGAIDGKPTRLFFLLVAPTVTSHLQMLARISRILRDPRLRQDLLLADRPQKVLALLHDADAKR